MSTLAEIEQAIESLPAQQIDELAAWLEVRRTKRATWPVPPPNVGPEELQRIDREIASEFSRSEGRV